MYQLINIKPVEEFVGIGHSTIYETIDENALYYGSTFPKKVKITQNRMG
ncbi:AlpA family phage regulatory protein [Acinetobacter oleivorans]|nr:AlpA family phage regulatory protein [Acinetobacter oleivorans]NUG00628.1 AlpA family phage regulatory protein [Acinetobacter oleivorans]